jgi:hypothetical protein
VSVQHITDLNVGVKYTLPTTRVMDEPTTQSLRKVGDTGSELCTVVCCGISSVENSGCKANRERERERGGCLLALQQNNS